MLDPLGRMSSANSEHNFGKIAATQRIPPPEKGIWPDSGHLSNTFFTRYPGAANMCDSGFIPGKGLPRKPKWNRIA